MSSTRQQKYARLIQKEVADILQQETRNLFGNILLTVTEVRVSPDLSVAKVYVSLFPVKEKGPVFEKLREHAFEIRKSLGMRIRHQARIVPELVFYLDETLDQADRIDELLKKK